MKLDVEIKRVHKNLFIASCNNLPGCHIQASSEEQAKTRIKEAIKLMLLSYKRHYEKAPIEI